MLSIVLLSVGCRSLSSSNSDSSFAHFPAESAFGGPIGRLEALKIGFPTDYTMIRICVETGKATIGDADLLLETRLAYAAWLDAAGGYEEADWQRYEFVGQSKCKSDDKAFAGFVAFLDLSNIEPGEDLLSRYQESKLICSTTGLTKSCQGNGLTLGWGGPGGMTYWYVGTPDKWTKISVAQPSSATLSPYVQWLSIEADLKRQAANVLPTVERDKLITEYALLRRQTAPTMADLAGFVSKLAANKVLATEDPIFKKLVQEFYTASGEAIERTYRSERASFPTLLHEVGHQFGMDHADHPNLDSVTGASSAATQTSDGQWVSDLAAMAYGDPYMYLVEDDRLGSVSNRDTIRKYLTDHK